MLNKYQIKNRNEDGGNERISLHKIKKKQCYKFDKKKQGKF